MSTTRLFLDWLHVYKGQMEVTLDQGQVSAEGRAAIERMKQERGGKHPELSGHGMRRALLPYGVRISIEPARKSVPWLLQDQPWEASVNWVTVIHDGDRYRCWYTAAFCGPVQRENAAAQPSSGDRQSDTATSGMCYAESLDGTHWVKPSLGLFVFAGSKDNNIVSLWQHESAVFRDESAPPNARYKCFVWDRIPADPNRSDHGLYGAVSPEGHRWTRLPDPLIRYFCDTQNIAYWDEQKRKYIGYFRGHLGGRAIGYAETDDFARWPLPVVISHPGPFDHPSDDYYNNGFTRHPEDPSIKLIFASIYHHDSDLVDVRLGLTHNGAAINWVSYDPIVPVGKPGEWDCAATYVGPSMVRLPDGTLAVPYRGCRNTHGESYGGFYGKDHVDAESACAWAVWDDGRLAGIETEHHGEFWCIPDEAFDGGTIEINARTTRVGSVEVELWDYYSNRVIAGFSFAECIPFRGNELWAPLRWRGKGELPELKGSRIILRFRLSSAKIFGYRLQSVK